MKQEIGKYCIDISKLVFGGVVLSQVLNITGNKILIIVLGLIASISFAIIGFTFLKNRKDGSNHIFHRTGHNRFNRISLYTIKKRSKLD